ncbi:RDD family protein [Nocardioides sp.]|uniref:RDD family protein n=1 Tax=Nocardioides sp. TaxID=35761 RepID=UPI0019C9ABF0|nr:RDD family protein [Nocardioides sp.]MBC7275683.1 RDD family protein [Nocardioides sp.]
MTISPHEHLIGWPRPRGGAWAAAAANDGLRIAGPYTLGIAGFGFLLEMFTSKSLTGERSTLLGVAAFAIWAFSYAFISLAITGRTIGKELAGLRVVRADGAAPGVRTMLVRTLVFPFSVAFFGNGLLLIVVQREHRSVHDLIAKTCVVYDWGDRSDEMPGPLSNFLNRAQSDSPQR